MGNNEFIEVHKKCGKRIEKVSIKKNQIIMVLSTKSGTFVCFLLPDGWGYPSRVCCIESYDEVMALINK